MSTEEAKPQETAPAPATDGVPPAGTTEAAAAGLVDAEGKPLSKGELKKREKEAASEFLRPLHSLPI